MRAEQMKLAKLKAANFCAYQERTQQEVRDKIFALGLFGNEVEQVLSELISENFVNEERFAISFTRGRFRIKHWGRLKIVYELKRRNISKYCISAALKEINEDEYLDTLRHLTERKLKEIGSATLASKQKTANFLISKGYETDLIWRILNGDLE